MKYAETEPVLEFLNVICLPHIQKMPASFSLLTARMIALVIEEDLPAADIAEGIIPPASGVVKFLQESWSKMAPDRELNMRALIGRVFKNTGWISNLNVMENITLAQRHHTKLKIPELEQKAEELAKFFGLKEIPKGRPALFKASDLRLCEWVRAFLGEYRLVIIESPAKDVEEAKLPLLTKKMEDSLQEGTAFLILSNSSEEIKKLRLKNLNVFVIK
jgi:ABC-type lipoprotein export system ATPase subunit